MVKIDKVVETFYIYNKGFYVIIYLIGEIIIMKKLQKLKCFLISLSTVVGIMNVPCHNVYADDNWPQPPDVSAESAIVMEADSGAILYEKNSHDRHYPASITKIMTTLLALENCPLSDTVHFSKDAVYKVEGTQVGITPEEDVPLDECLYGIMLASGNEIAYAVAEHTGGTFENFVDMMNKRAAELGCTNTHFNNPHGLPDENHYTCAYDMALISRAAYSNETFRNIAGTKYHIIPPTNLYGEERAMANHHKMLTNSIYHYDYCTGGKTGYTNAARYNLVTFAEKDGLKLICVIMKDEESAGQYADTTNLFNYCFQNFRKTAITTNDLGVNLDGSGLFPINDNVFTEDTSSISIGENAYIVLPSTLQLENTDKSASYDGSNNISSIDYSYNGHLLGSVPIISKTNETATAAPSNEPSTAKKSFFKINLRVILYIILGLALIAGAAYLIKAFILGHHFDFSRNSDYSKKRRRRARNKRKAKRARQNRNRPI